MRVLLLLCALAAVAALASITPAGAHSRPVRFDPAPGEVLASPPAAVTGWFTSDLRRAEESFIHVLDSEGAEVQTGEVELSSDRRQMSTALQPGLGEGRYVVHWSTFDDADGEVFAGCYAFFVGQAAADAAVEAGAALDAAAECPAATEDHSHDESGGSTAAVSISIPEVVEGDSVTIEITPVNFTARKPDGSTVDPHFGHYHLWLDKVPVEVLTGEHSHADGDDHGDGMAGSTGSDEQHEESVTELPGGLVENPVMTFENTFTFTNLEPGWHTVAVALTYDDHSIMDPPVMAAQTFRVEGDGSGGIPAWALVVAIAGGLVVGGGGVKLLGSRTGSAGQSS